MEEILIKNLQKTLALKPRQITRLAQKTLRLKKISDYNLSLVFVSDKYIRSLNQKYLKRSYATDVLAFNLKNPKEKSKSLFGEVIISADTVKKNAKAYSTTAQKELILCVVHGILHLLGYDDHKPSDIKRMRKEEARVLNSILK